MHTTSTLTFADHWDHFLVRWGYRRGGHRVTPGLYTIGNPTPESPVLVTANYSLSFDAVRSSLPGADGYILVLDTLGVNVWCAAGKGTFSTDEIVRRVEATRLSEVVSHRTLILPELGGPRRRRARGQAAHGLKVEYGPVRAADLPEYLKNASGHTGDATSALPLARPAGVDPVELVQLAAPTALAALMLACSWDR
jgi:hypothetical protein